MTQKKKIKYSNARMKQGLNKIVDEIQEKELELDYIVGIARGGAIPAVYLSHLLNKPVEIIPWSLRDHMLAHGNLPTFGIMSDLNKGKKILIVDDIIDEGHNIRSLLDEWKKRSTKMEGIKICSLFYNRHNKGKVKADFYHLEHKPHTWVVFDWEI